VGEGENVVINKVAVTCIGSSLLAALALTGCGPAAPKLSAHPMARACATDAFLPVQLQGQVRPSIVRLESDKGMATGFVIRRPGSGILIATNYHVVRGGSRFDAIFDSGARLGNVEVVKIDIEHDLELLKAPGAEQLAAGLPLSRTPVVLAQRIAAMGYPYVEGEREPSLTFEDGIVTAAKTELDGHAFIRTNANINPGNSGGPVIDACAQVVGIVDAVHKETQRTGLVIPIDQLQSLVAALDAPHARPEAEIAARISALESAVRYKRGEDVAAMLSRHTLSEGIMKVFLQSLESSLESAQTKLNNYLLAKAETDEPYVVEGMIITDYHALPTNERGALMVKALSDSERESVVLFYMLSEHKIDEQTAMIRWLGQFAHELFGSDPTFKLEQVSAQGKTAKSRVHVGASRYYEFTWIYEWGDWRIDDFECVRGCK